MAIYYLAIIFSRFINAHTRNYCKQNIYNKTCNKLDGVEYINGHAQEVASAFTFFEAKYM